MEALGRPRWRHLLLEARTARSWRIPFTVLRGRTDDGTWTDADRQMALALTAYEDTICSGCGLPSGQTYGDDNVGRWEVAETICHGCEAVESAQKDQKDPYPGKKLVLQEA